MGDVFKYLETVTVYATPGFAYAEHRTPPLGKERGMYRVARITSGTDGTSAIQYLANEFMRMIANGSFEWQVVDEMAEVAARVMARANFSLTKVRRAWGVLSQSVQHAQFCRRQSARWPYHP